MDKVNHIQADSCCAEREQKAMKEKPISFNDEMVAAIIDGRKTQTRRPIKPQPDFHHWEELPGYHFCPSVKDTIDGLHARFSHWLDDTEDEDKVQWIKFRYGNVGDHMCIGKTGITLEITDVRIEQLQDITNADAIAEGCHVGPGAGNWRNARHKFQDLWDSIYTKDRFGWGQRVYVWVISFIVREK